MPCCCTHAPTHQLAHPPAHLRPREYLRRGEAVPLATADAAHQLIAHYGVQAVGEAYEARHNVRREPVRGQLPAAGSGGPDQARRTGTETINPSEETIRGSDRGYSLAQRPRAIKLFY